MKTRLMAALGLLLFSACQQQGVVLNPLSTQFRQQASQATDISSMPLTAKWAENEASRLAKQWNPNAVLTHVLGVSVLASGEPHATAGSWTFSFVDEKQPQQALQIVFRKKLSPVIKQLSAQQLPQAEPLEIRAWGLDSDRAVLKAREFFGQNVSLRYMELTQDQNGRLVWSFDHKPLLDAMHGKPYEPMRRAG